MASAKKDHRSSNSKSTLPALPFLVEETATEYLFLTRLLPAVFQTFGFKLFFKNYLVHDNFNMQMSSKFHHSNTSDLKECLS